MPCEAPGRTRVGRGVSGRRRTFVLLATVVLVLGGRIGYQLITWYQAAPERELLVSLEAELEDAAVGLITTQVASDTLKEAIEAVDVELGRGRQLLDNLEGRPGFRGGADATYLRELREFNRKVVARNQMVEDWRSTVANNHSHVDRYNMLADSIRSVATRMGEPYYPVRTPAEIATARGVPGRGG